MDNFKADCVDTLRSKFLNKKISKRDFMRLCMLMGAGAAVSSMGISKAFAAAESLTVSNYGGDTTKAWTDAWVTAFERDSGINVIQDGSGPLIGSVKKMVDERNVYWDLVDGDGMYAPILGGDYLEPIDYSIVDPNAFFSWNKQVYGAGSYVYSHVLAYDKTKLSSAPTSWVDFFDLKKFPGKRTMYKWFLCMPEACMLAAGKKPEEIYPIDMDLVIKMVKDLGDNLVVWDTGASSQQLFLDEEVVMGNIWNTRAVALARDTKGRVEWTWNQQIVVSATWNIPKGAKHVPAAQRFIAASQKIDRQIKLLDAMGNGPANPAAVAQLNDAQKKLNPTSHLETAIIRNDQWYAEHHTTEIGNWIDAISG